MNKPSFSGPWLPWFHGDFLRATQGWTVAERGIYFLLLGASWEMGPLPDDRRRLAGIVGAQLEEFDQGWATIRHKFELTQDGLINRRLEFHRATQATRSEKARQSANKRWRDGTDANAERTQSERNARGDAPAMLEGMLGECSSELRTQNLKTQTTELKPARATARSVAAASATFHREIVEAYHDLCPDLPRIKMWTDARRRSLDARIAERKRAGKPADTIEYWRSVFEQVACNDFLCGREGRSWRAGLPWLLKQENFAKTIEGNYTDRTRSTNGAHAHG